MENSLSEFKQLRETVNAKQIKWMGLYNQDPEFASVVMEIFDMPEEDIKFFQRNIATLKDSLRFYKDDINRAKRKKKVTAVVV